MSLQVQVPINLLVIVILVELGLVFRDRVKRLETLYIGTSLASLV